MNFDHFVPGEWICESDPWCCYLHWAWQEYDCQCHGHCLCPEAPGMHSVRFQWIHGNLSFLHTPFFMSRHIFQRTSLCCSFILLKDHKSYSTVDGRWLHGIYGTVINWKYTVVANWFCSIEVELPGSQIRSDKITFGAHVRIEEESEEGKKRLYQIVGEDEADVHKGKISINSPLARSLIGRKKGDEFEFHSPGGGEKFYHILEFYFK